MKLVVAQSGGDAGPEFGSAELMQTMSNLLESDVVVEPVIRDLRLQTSAEEFFRRLGVTYRPGSSVLEVSLKWQRKEAAAPILLRVSREFQRLVDEKLGVRSTGLATGTGRPLIAVSVFDPPHVEPNRVSPKPVRLLGFAGALGLVLALVLAFARESLDERIRGRDDAEESFGAPVIGTLPKGLLPTGIRSPGASRLSRARAPALADALHVLRANLLFSHSAVHGPTILVTSAMPQDGKSTVASSLAWALASAGQDVICVDADVRRPVLHEYLQADGQAGGLVEVLSGAVEIDDALQTVRISAQTSELVERVAALSPGAGDTRPTLNAMTRNGRLRLLAGGISTKRTAPPEAGTMLTGERVDALVEQLRARADFVIFDGPPLLVADAFPLAVQSDTVLVVAREGRTTRDKAKMVRATLAGLGVERFAVVLTEAEQLDDYGYR